jgi:hypothetical protein
MFLSKNKCGTYLLPFFFKEWVVNDMPEDLIGCYLAQSLDSDFIILVLENYKNEAGMPIKTKHFRHYLESLENFDFKAVYEEDNVVVYSFTNTTKMNIVLTHMKANNISLLPESQKQRILKFNNHNNNHTTYKVMYKVEEYRLELEELYSVKIPKEQELCQAFSFKKEYYKPNATEL